MSATESQLPSSEAENTPTIIPTMPDDLRPRHSADMRSMQQRNEAAKRQPTGSVSRMNLSRPPQASRRVPAVVHSEDRQPAELPDRQLFPYFS